jgi:hypothetical protein
MDALPQEDDWCIVKLSTCQHHLQSLLHHPLIKILARGELLMIRAQQVRGVMQV